MRCCAGGGRLKECRPPPFACTSNSGAVRGNLMWLGCGDGLLQGPQSNLHWYSHVAAHSMTPRSLWHGRASPFGAVTHRTSGEGDTPALQACAVQPAVPTVLGPATVQAGCAVPSGLCRALPSRLCCAPTHPCPCPFARAVARAEL